MIAIIDYGVGNLRSVEKALQKAGAEAKITSNPEEILGADGVVLPGVGAFEEAMNKLTEAGLAVVVKTVVGQNKPFLGICLGMQMLFERSEEGEKQEPVAGLGLFKGSIKRFPEHIGLKVPHMGWNTVELKGSSRLFNGIENGTYFYFVHSFYLESYERDIVAATADYGIEFDAAVSRGNVFATQFHPEKSGEAGLLLLQNFIRIVEEVKTA